MTFFVIDSANSINNSTAGATALNVTVGDNVIVKADGSVLATGSGGTGIFVTANGSNTTVLVDGLVYGTSYGIVSEAGGAHITINGHVVSGSIGVSVDSGSVFVSPTGVITSSFDAVLLTTGSELNNDGTVNSDGNEAVDLHWGSVNNNGLISSRSDAIYYYGETRSSIRNTGTVLGNLTSIDGGADPGLNFTNSGRWDGNLKFSTGADYIVNTGTITGQVDLHDGDNQLDSRYGLIVGAVTAGSGNDIILLGAGDNDIVGGGGGDTIDGGAGFDTLSYSASTAGVSVNLLTATATGGDAKGDHLSNIEGLYGTFYRDTLVGDDSANLLNGELGRDTLIGNGGNDTLIMLGAGFTGASPGPAVIDGGSGNDLIQLQSADPATYGFAFNARTQVQGGTGYDTLELSRVPVVTFTSTTVRGIENVFVDDGYDYDLTTVDATVASGARMMVDGSALTLGNNLRFNGAAETNGAFDLLGGASIDTLTGGAGSDTLTGAGGGDILTGHVGSDTFIFNDVSESTFSHLDHITDFDASADRLQFKVEVAGLNTKVSGSASTAADIHALVNGHMTADHAILVNVTGGSLAGMSLLLVDANHTDGYQSATDYCIDVTGMVGTLALSDFIM